MHKVHGSLAVYRGMVLHVCWLLDSTSLLFCSHTKWNVGFSSQIWHTLWPWWGFVYVLSCSCVTYTSVKGVHLCARAWVYWQSMSTLAIMAHVTLLLQHSLPVNTAHMHTHYIHCSCHANHMHVTVSSQEVHNSLHIPSGWNGYSTHIVSNTLHTTSCLLYILLFNTTLHTATAVCIQATGSDLRLIN